MYHTEGYIDKESVDAGSHMVSLAGQIQGQDVLVWAVWPERAKARQYQDRLRQWFTEELGAVIPGPESRINRELLRVSSGLKCRLYLYYDKRLYRAGKQAQEGEYQIGPCLGACVHREGEAASLPLTEELEDMQRTLKKENPTEDDSGESTTALLGNIWQKNIMDCVMEDSLNYAYFMLWETR
ncbi:MAG: hypothetical protein LUE16_06765 [Lachnospiraceae bacterium]|nr:hypothetical protein [Lachnospiraceae bacterium]